MYSSSTIDMEIVGTKVMKIRTVTKEAEKVRPEKKVDTGGKCKVVGSVRRFMKQRTVSMYVKK